MPADLGQLCADVATATNRPELMGEIQLAVRQATKEFHMRQFFMRDSREDLFTFPIANYTFQIDISDPAVFTRFRKLRYIKKYDTLNSVVKEGQDDVLREADPNALFDRYGNKKNNVYYLGGTNLNILCNSQENALLISWYVYPDTAPESFSSWIAELYDVIIVKKATAIILNHIGMEAESKALLDEIETVHWPIVVANDIEVTA